MMITDYERKPIQLNKSVIVLLQLFRIKDGLIDVGDSFFLEDYSDPKKDLSPDYFKESAAQFIKQFEGEAAPAFFMALIMECFKELEEHDQEFETNWVLKYVRKIKKEYERLLDLEKYRESHMICLDCGSDNIDKTKIEIPMNKWFDPNTFTCLDCGVKGLVRDLRPLSEQEELKYQYERKHPNGNNENR